MYYIGWRIWHSVRGIPGGFDLGCCGSSWSSVANGIIIRSYFDIPEDMRLMIYDLTTDKKHIRLVCSSCIVAVL